jgi:hypothetical protein
VRFAGILIVLLCATVFNGCITTSDLLEKSRQVPAPFSAGAYSETYFNKDTVSKGFTLWSALYHCKSFRKDPFESSAGNVKLQYDGKNRLTVTLIENSLDQASISLKVKRRGNHLSVKRNFFLVPVPFFYTRYREARVLLSSDASGNLLVNYAHRQFIWVLMAGSGGQHFNQVHVKNPAHEKR